MNYTAQDILNTLDQAGLDDIPMFDASTAFVAALGGYQWINGASQPTAAVQASAAPEAAAPVLAALEDNAYLLAHHDETSPALVKVTHTSEGTR